MSSSYRAQSTKKKFEDYLQVTLLDPFVFFLAARL
jgi:hypothetical protein